MRKGILFMLLCLISVVAVACGGGNNAAGGGNGGSAACGGDACGGDGGEADGDDYWDRYVSTFKEGRSWMLKSTTTMEGMDPMVSFTKYEVTAVSDEEATVTMTMLDKDKNPMAGVDPNEMKVSLKQPEAPADTGEEAPAQEWKEETVTVAAGEFEAVSIDGKNWMMKKHPYIQVKSDAGNTQMELVEFND